MPTLKAASHKTESILIGSNAGSLLDTDAELEDGIRGGKWEDEEERRFFEDIPDLKDYVPKGILGVEEESDAEKDKEEEAAEKEKQAKARVDEDVRQLEEELAGLEASQNEELQSSRDEEAKDNEPVDEEDE